jgi:hypothetical protein
MKPIIDKIIVPVSSSKSMVFTNMTSTANMRLTSLASTLMTPQKYSVRIIAGLKHPCTPVDSPCCKPAATTDKHTQRTALTSPAELQTKSQVQPQTHVHAVPVEFYAEPPCIFAPQGFQADSYIYALAASATAASVSVPVTAYVCTLPLITNGLGGNESTFHQDHVLSIHFNAFQRQRTIINELLSGKVVLPVFARPACHTTQEKDERSAPFLLPPMEKVSTEKNCQWSSIDMLSQPGADTNRFLNVVAIITPNKAGTNTDIGSAFEPKTFTASDHAASKVKEGVQIMPNSSLAHYQQVFGKFNTNNDLLTASSAKIQATGSFFHTQPRIYADELVVPDDIEKTWRGTKCRLQSDQLASIQLQPASPPNQSQSQLRTSTSRQGLLDALDNLDRRQEDTTHRDRSSSNARYEIEGLCGRGGNKNSVDDLALTITHLLALHKALKFYQAHNQARKSNTAPQQVPDTRFSSVGRYVLVLEEDVQFAFDIDFQALIKFAPPQFAMLQLTNTDHKLLWQRHRKYYDQQKPAQTQQSTTQRNYDTRAWDKRDTLIESWATSAYLVDLAMVGPTIESMVSMVPKQAGETEQYRFKVIAGIVRPCVPRECCVSSAQGVVFAQPAFTQLDTKAAAAHAQTQSLMRVPNSCVLSPKGFISDAFIPSMFDYAGIADISAGGVYVSNLPLIVNGINGQFKDDYNKRYRMDKESAKGLVTQRRMVNQLYEAEKAFVPAFIKPACVFGVDKDVT